MRKITVLTFILFISSTTFARKPAVDPVVGVSIEEYKEVPPEKAKGYDFNRRPNSEKRAASTKRTHSVEGLKVESATDTSASSGKLIFLFLIFLPIVASGITFYRLGRKFDGITKDSNVTDINKNKKDSDHDDFDIPKAS
ncbi:MAG: hypothetical protein BM556_04785 [Bacteriovorax sp. MedPE-SWde]|nr:MAG: hypothetical protein BM556_04785 [Bacteriovorax sp. MedPE-SWde]